MNSGDSIASEQFQTRFEQQFFLERVAYLHGRAIFTRLLCQFTRCEGRTRKTIATRLGADVKNRIAAAFCCAARDLFVAQYAEAKHVYQGIAFEAFVEINFAPDGRYADTVAIVRDPGDDAGEEPLVSGDVWCLTVDV